MKRDINCERCHVKFVDLSQRENGLKVRITRLPAGDTLYEFWGKVRIFWAFIFKVPLSNPGVILLTRKPLH